MIGNHITMVNLKEWKIQCYKFFAFSAPLCRNSALSGAIFAAVFEKPLVLTIKNLSK